MDYVYEIAYLNLDALQLVLRGRYGTQRLLPMIIFDTAHLHDWKLCDRIAIDVGSLSPRRDMEKTAGLHMSEDDYTLHNQRTGGKAPIRKNDYECEDAFAWLRQLEAQGVISPPCN